MQQTVAPAQPIDVIAGPRMPPGWPWTEQTAAERYNASQSWPRISIVTPSYNQGNFIEQTIRSVLLQNYPNLEYIIIDGGSTDETVDVIKRYGKWINYWVSEPDKGQSHALQKGFNKATGEILAWMNSDDFYEKDALLKVGRAYMQQPFSFYCGSCKMINENDALIQQLYTPKVSFATLIRYWKPHFCPPQPSIFFSRHAFDHTGQFNVGLKYAMDYELWLKAVSKHKFTIVNEPLSYYRVHSASKTGSGNGLEKFIPEWKRVIHEHLKQRPAYVRLQFTIEEQLHFLYRRMKYFSGRVKRLLIKAV